MVEFLSAGIWTRITSLTLKSTQTKVAVAYFGTGGAKLLPLKKEDTLLIAMDISNVKGGKVNPWEIERLYSKGVEIFNVRNLHAKIYLFDKKVIIGSANTSNNSASENLLEAAILTDDKSTHAAAAHFIKNNCVEKIGQDYIDLCKKEYRPPKNDIGGRKQRAKGVFRGLLSKLWVISTKLIYFTEKDSEITEKDEHVFVAKIANKKIKELKTIRFPVKSRFVNRVNEGDIVVEIDNQGGRAMVKEPQRVLGVTFSKGNNYAYLRLEDSRAIVSKSWTSVDKELRRKGIKYITKKSTREIKDENVKKLLWDLFR